MLQHQRCFPRTLARQRSRLCARLRSRSQPGAGVERNRTRCICRIHSNGSARSTALSGQRSRACMWTLSAASTAAGRMKVAPRMENCTLVYIHRTRSRHTLLASLANSCRRSSSSRPLLSRRERGEACSLESNQLGLGRGPAQYSAVAELIQTNDHRIARIYFQWRPQHKQRKNKQIEHSSQLRYSVDRGEGKRERDVYVCVFVEGSTSKKENNHLEG